MKNLVLVLHAHLPWGHLEDDNDAAARWLLEASVDCYQPLLRSLERVAADGVPFRVTVSVSPPLKAMWKSPRFSARLERYVAGERARYEKAALTYRRAANFHLARLAEPRADLLAGFARLPQVELICSTATHGFLPLLATVPAAARAQVTVAAQDHRAPLPGMWLAECGYCDGADRWLLDQGVGYCFLDSHALAHAPHHHHRSVRTRSGLHVFARDPLASEQVWSRESGYPGDPAYLDFHHRVADLRVLKVPGDAPWDPDAARARARAHAKHFVEQREQTQAEVIVSPYDAELFGHWWFEGPDFLEAVLQEAAASRTLKLATASDHLRDFPQPQTVELSASSWGRGGHSAVWLDPSNAWLWPHLHRAGKRMIALASQERSEAIAVRALAQAGRELLLAQSSDWPFLLEAKTNAAYAAARFEDHLVAFRALADQLERNVIDVEALARREVHNDLFEAIDARVFSGKY